MKLSCINIVLFFILFSCSDADSNSYEKKTEVFSNYLKKTFRAEIPDGKHYFVLISDFGCTGCKEKNILELNEYINEENANYFTVITADSKLLNVFLFSGLHILNDRKKELETIALELANLTLIEVINGKISFIKSFNPEDPPITTFIKL